ncbi:MAG: DUF1801 domain-containing protein [Chitinophagaceae bacterium]
MAKVEIKTKQNTGDVDAFLLSVEDETKRNDGMTLLKIFKQVTKEKPMMWGTSIVGFGKYTYKSPTTSRSGEWYITGFSPRKQNLTIYIMPGFKLYADLLKKLGKHKTGGGCLYINKLSDVDEKILKELLTISFKQMKDKYSTTKNK